ncbi:hypothetical protein U9M48_044106 [Paspalum notatum var. saurae]|uniref:Uncharacterized protein n=1 Tax=Paspalum notatum var. saurae TaxID=547442 RepID=A0AAQ3XGA7_PASNO
MAARPEPNLCQDSGINCKFSPRGPTRAASSACSVSGVSAWSSSSSRSRRTSASATSGSVARTSSRSVTLFLVHCAGCLYYLIADRYPHHDKTWIDVAIPNFRQASLCIRYIFSIYWSITTMTTVSLEHPRDGLQHLLNALQPRPHAYLIGNMTNLVVEGTHRIMEFVSSS